MHWYNGEPDADGSSKKNTGHLNKKFKPGPLLPQHKALTWPIKQMQAHIPNRLKLEHKE